MIGSFFLKNIFSFVQIVQFSLLSSSSLISPPLSPQFCCWIYVLIFQSFYFSVLIFIFGFSLLFILWDFFFIFLRIFMIASSRIFMMTALNSWQTSLIYQSPWCCHLLNSFYVCMNYGYWYKEWLSVEVAFLHVMLWDLNTNPSVLLTFFKRTVVEEGVGIPSYCHMG